MKSNMSPSETIREANIVGASGLLMLVRETSAAAMDPAQVIGGRGWSHGWVTIRIGWNHGSKVAQIERKIQIQIIHGINARRTRKLFHVQRSVQIQINSNLWRIYFRFRPDSFERSRCITNKIILIKSTKSRKMRLNMSSVANRNLIRPS